MLLKKVSNLESRARTGGGGAGAGSGASGGQPREKDKQNQSGYIPYADLKKWKEANPTKCFLFHLKKDCPEKGGSCRHGLH